MVQNRYLNQYLIPGNTKRDLLEHKAHNKDSHILALRENNLP